MEVVGIEDHVDDIVYSLTVSRAASTTDGRDVSVLCEDIDGADPSWAVDVEEPTPGTLSRRLGKGFCPVCWGWTLGVASPEDDLSVSSDDDSGLSVLCGVELVALSEVEPVSVGSVGDACASDLSGPSPCDGWVSEVRNKVFCRAASYSASVVGLPLSRRSVDGFVCNPIGILISSLDSCPTLGLARKTLAA